MRVCGHWRKVQGVVGQQQQGNHQGLCHLYAVDAGQNVYTVRTEDCYCGHVGVVKPAKVHQLSNIALQRQRHHDLCHPKVHKVYHEDWNRSECWYEKLVAPSNVEEIIADTKYNDRLERKNGGEVKGKLLCLIGG